MENKKNSTENKQRTWIFFFQNREIVKMLSGKRMPGLPTNCEMYINNNHITHMAMCW